MREPGHEGSQMPPLNTILESLSIQEAGKERDLKWILIIVFFNMAIIGGGRSKNKSVVKPK